MSLHRLDCKNTDTLDHIHQPFLHLTCVSKRVWNVESQLKFKSKTNLFWKMWYALLYDHQMRSKDTSLLHSDYSFLNPHHWSKQRRYIYFPSCTVVCNQLHFLHPFHPNPCNNQNFHRSDPPRGNAFSILKLKVMFRLITCSFAFGSRPTIMHRESKGSETCAEGNVTVDIADLLSLNC